VAMVLAFVSLSIRFRFRPPQSSRMAATIIAASVMGCANLIWSHSRRSRQNRVPSDDRSV
jgi:hypothetical protein